jgi:hypothetical protein
MICILYGICETGQCFLLVYFEFKKEIGHMYNMLLCIELIRRYAR